MYRLKEIEDRLSQVVGWRQPYDPQQQIEEVLTASESGLFFQDAHPLLTLKNVRSIMPDTFGYQYPVWNAEMEYRVGSKVSHLDKTWIALADNVGEEPATGSRFWKEYNMLSDYLSTITRSGIAEVIQTFIQMKQLTNETKSLLERRTFYDGAGRLKDIIENRGRMCGYEITPARSMGVTTKIERIGLQMTGATGMVRLYLFHSSQSAPLRTLDLEFTASHGGFQWFDVQDLYLPYLGDENNAGGSWYLCYDQNDLPKGMEAVNISKDWSREPCGTCNMGNIQTWRLLTKYLQVMPFMFKAPSDFKDYPELWDIAHNVYTNTVSYGLNVEISVGCDLTDFIVKQRHLFATVIQRQVAVKMLRTLAMNPEVRVNRNESNASKMDILYELDGNTTSPRQGGLGYELRKAYEALRLDTRGLDPICLNCNNHGVKYRSV